MAFSVPLIFLNSQDKILLYQIVIALASPHTVWRQVRHQLYSPYKHNMVTDGHPVDFFVVSSTVLGNVSMSSWLMRTWLWHYTFYCLCDTQCAYRALLCSVVGKKKTSYCHISGCFFYQLVTSYPWEKSL